MIVSFFLLIEQNLILHQTFEFIFVVNAYDCYPQFVLLIL